MREHWAHYLRWLREDFSARQEEYISTDVTDPMRDKAPEEHEQAERADDGGASPALEALRKYREGKILLIGNPGLGKTTTVRKFILEQAARAEKRPSAEIPVLIEPKYHSSSTSIIGLITLFLNRCGSDVSEKTVTGELRSGKMLLLFDGLNEIPSDNALRDLSCFVEDFSQSTPMVFTSRAMRTAGTKGVKIRLVMKGLSVPQREKFVRKSLGAEADKMLLELERHSSTLGETPLLLKMLCDVFRRHGHLPRNLGLALQEWIAGHSEYLAQELRGTEADRRIWPKLMNYLAFAMTKGDHCLYARLAVSKERAVQILADFLAEKKWGNPGTQAEKFLQQLCNYHLLKITGERRVVFLHQLLQEYFAAEYLLGLLPQQTDENLKRDWLNYVKWTESISMAMEISDKDDFQMRLLSLALEVDSVLAARLAGAATNSSKSIAVLTSQDIPPKLKADLLGRSRCEAALPELEQALKERNPMIRETAALAMGKSGIPAASKSLAHALFDKYPSVLWNAAESLRQIDATPAEEFLLEALKVGDKHVRWAAAKALGGLRGHRAQQALIKSLTDPDGNVRHKAAESLGAMSAEEAIPQLIECLADPDWHVAGGAAEALGKFGSLRSEEALLERLFHDHSHVRKAAAKALDRLGSNKVRSVLVDRLTAPDPFLRRWAAEGLENVDRDESVPPLIEALADEEPSVRWTAARALGEKRAGDSAPRLIELLTDLEASVVLTAVRALGQLGRIEAVEPLDQLQHNSPPDSELHFACLEVLAKLGSSIAIEKLLAMVMQKNHPRRVRATLILGELDCNEATEALFDLLSHETWLIRLRAADKLAGFADHSLIERLKELFDKNQDLLLIDLMSWIQQRWGFYDTRLLPWERNFHILHLSDLHFGSKDDATIWFSALLLDIEKALKPPRIDSIIISGDIIYGRQKEDGFEPAATFLQNLLAKYDVHPGDVVIVPGNHDLDLGEQAERLYQFRKFYSSIKGEEYPSESDDQATVYEFADQRVIILGLNSAWEIDAKNVKRASIHQTALNKGITKAMQYCKDQRWIKIAVWHHPLMSKWDDFIKDHDFVKTLSKASFRIALHGHAHSDTYWEWHGASEELESVRFIGAGTFGGPPEGLVPAVPWQYNFFSIRGNRVMIYIRRKESGSGPWQQHKDIEFQI